MDPSATSSIHNLVKTVVESHTNKMMLDWACQTTKGLCNNVIKLQESYSDAVNHVNDLETRLKEAQKLYYMEKQKVTSAIKERNKLMSLLNSARDVLKDDKVIMLNDTREKLNFLNQPSETFGIEKLDTIVELNSTDYLMSELSYTLDEEDISSGDTSLRRSRRQKRAPCRFPSDESLNVSQPKKSKRRQTTTKYSGDGEEQVIATTTVTVPHGGPVTATSVIESIPHVGSKIQLHRVEEKFLPSAPPMALDSDSESMSSGGIKVLAQKRPFSCQTNTRLHNWIQKSHIMGETCSVCLKKIKFSTVAFKCSNCKAVAHTNCKEKVPLPCVPVAITTPNTKSSKQGCLRDYVPQTSPMVPSLIVHCIREIEARGLNEVGLYRVPGSDKEVKTLKERLLKAKGVIDLSKVTDIHAVCGCLKDFLRCLKESLVSRNKWDDFAKITEIQSNEEKKEKLLNKVQTLAQPNRDTLAYLVIHLQKVAASPNCKMPITNLSKMFGPSIVGYSKTKPEDILVETYISNKIMADFLQLPTELWEEILYSNNSENQNPDLLKTPSQSSVLGFFSNSTSSVKTVKKYKFFDTP